MNKVEITNLIVGQLQSHKAELQRLWNTPNEPGTRFFFLDDLLPEELASAIYKAFPSKADGFVDRASFREKKKTLTDLSHCDPLLSAITYAMQDPQMIKEIGEITAIPNLVPDPSLYAAGLSMMFKGDFLNPHIDNSHDGTRRLYRRMNFLYYVSPQWTLENGGNFELWDQSVRTSETIVSRFNRLLVMETNKTSWHAVSPVKAVEPRCCVSTYVFSENSPDETDYFHVTSFLGRPEEPSKRLLGHVDNRLRQAVSVALGTGRGRRLINKKDDSAT